VHYKDFLNLFICPLCKRKIIYEQKSKHLKCASCSHTFPIIDGIVDAFVPIEGLKTFNIKLAERYEHWGQFVNRGESDKRRKNITVDLVEGNLLLEIGCAEGFMTFDLAKKVPQVIASDISLSYLKRAKAEVPRANFTRLDIHNIPFGDNAFDCLVCTEVLEHVLSPLRALEEMNRVLKSDGFLVLSVPNGMTFPRIFAHMFRKKDSLIGFPGAHINFYDTGSLLQILEIAGFTANVVTTNYVPLPLVGRIMGKVFPYLGRVTIVKAFKKRIDYWEKLDTILGQREDRGESIT